jgi:hypothetical protein
MLTARYISGSSSIASGATFYDTITLYGRGVDSVFFKNEASGTLTYNLNYEVTETINNDSKSYNSFATALRST